VTPSEALQHIATLVEASAGLKDDTQRKVLLWSVVVVAQKGLGVAPDGVVECAPNVLTFPTREVQLRTGFCDQVLESNRKFLPDRFNF
jgi:hypothetical protein